MMKNSAVGDENMLQLLSKTFSEVENCARFVRAMEIPGVGCEVLERVEAA